MRGGAGQAQRGRCDVSAPEQPQGVLLRYAGGEVYALARPRVGRVWSLTIAGVTLKCVMHVEGDTIPDGAWLRVKVDLTTFAATPAVLRRVDVMTAARVAAEAAEHARVALEMERAPKRPARRAGKAKAKGKAKR